MSKVITRFIVAVVTVFSFLFVLPVMSVADSGSLSLTCEKTVFLPFEEIVVYIEVTNTDPSPVVRYLESGISSVDGSFIGELTLDQVELQPLEQKTFDYKATVLETMPAGEYKIGVKLLTEDLDEVLDEENLSIEIMGTKKIIDINLLSCRDEICSEEAKVFVLNEDVYLDYNSPVADLIATASLRLPDGSIEEITLPMSFHSEQIGTYELEITASKEGYQTITKTMIFSVIEETPDIPFAKPRWDINEDGIVDYKDLAILGAHYGETTQAPYPRYDIDRDGEVGTNDVDVLMAHYGEETSH
jgi:hypothetical protein